MESGILDQAFVNAEATTGEVARPNLKNWRLDNEEATKRGLGQSFSGDLGGKTQQSLG